MGPWNQSQESINRKQELVNKSTMDNLEDLKNSVKLLKDRPPIRVEIGLLESCVSCIS